MMFLAGSVCEAPLAGTGAGGDRTLPVFFAVKPIPHTRAALLNLKPW